MSIIVFFIELMLVDSKHHLSPQHQNQHQQKYSQLHENLNFLIHQ